jgi:hypothetical protein
MTPLEDGRKCLAIDFLWLNTRTMDYNDIRARLSRTMASLNERFDDDIDKYVRIEEWSSGEGVSIIFGGEDEEALLNRIMIILYNLSSLKDHIKNRLSAKGLNPMIVETEIDNSLHLQVLIDIVNQEKHGTPLKKSRSNKRPVIRYPRIGYFPFRKHPDADPDDEEGTMVIHALIKDNQENLLFRLDDLVETCFAKWNELINNNNLA